jgi:hypothetical protein
MRPFVLAFALVGGGVACSSPSDPAAGDPPTGTQADVIVPVCTEPQDVGTIEPNNVVGTHQLHVSGAKPGWYSLRVKDTDWTIGDLGVEVVLTGDRS